MEIKYLKRDCVNKRGLDLSKEVLWISVGQKAADLRAVKVGGQRKILPIGPRTGNPGSNRAARQNFLFTSNFDSLQLCCPLTYRDPWYLFRKI